MARWWDRLRTSLWLVPGGMTAGACVLALVSLAVDRSLDGSASEHMSWLYSGGPEGARSLLATVAGSMATVAGVTFSITMVALTMASAQFGPHLLRNFLRDTGNQFVLGTFVATFVYCLLVLRTVRDPEETAFVPPISMTVGLLLAVLSFGVLIYFIHHVSSSIQAESVIAAVGAECDQVIAKLYPDPESDEEETEYTWYEDGPSAAEIERDGQPVLASRSGYIQAVSRSDLMSIAGKHDLVVWVRYRPGDFVIAGAVLMHLWPGDRGTEDIRKHARSCVVMGSHRTPLQDVEFAINQLVEVASRALSAGINDPFTAITCIDRLGAILATLAQRRFPPPYRLDERGDLRLIEDRVTFEGAVDAALNQIRQYGRDDVSVLIRLLETVAFVAEFTRRPVYRRALLKHADMVRAAGQSVPEERDRDCIEARYHAARSALE